MTPEERITELEQEIKDLKGGNSQENQLDGQKMKTVPELLLESITVQNDAPVGTKAPGFNRKK